MNIALLITLAYAVVEAVVGWWSGSLALLSDAAHMLTDSVALMLAVLAAWIARRPPTRMHTYGYGRAEILAALLNAILMLVTLSSLTWHAIERFSTPLKIEGAWVSWTAAGGLAINLAVAWLLSHKHEKNLNQRAALMHVMGDTLGSVAALASGLVITFTGWTMIDPLLSLFICGLILISTLNLLYEAVHTLMEGVPTGCSLEEIGAAMSAIDDVASVHDLHIWALGSAKIALSAHIVLDDAHAWPQVLPRLHNMLEERFGIDHATLQPEVAPATFIRAAEIESTEHS